MDGYVECSECGHPVELHDRGGCRAISMMCSCAVGWTRKEIERLRRENGLPGRWPVGSIS